jgi:cAMP-dependent protein kinase regulator
MEKIQQVEKQISMLNKARPKIRATIFSTPVDMSVDFEPPQYPKSDAERKFLAQALSSNFIFMDLSDEQRNLFIDAMEKETVKEKKTIIHQGDNGDFFYILQTGKVNFVDGEDKVGDCEAGGSFGELALLYNSPRAVSCIAASPTVTIWKIDQKTFRYLLARHAHSDQQNLKECVHKISIFQNLDSSTISRFINAMTPVKFKKDDQIVQKGQVGTVFYIIQEGKVKIHDIGLGDSRYEDQILGPGDWFGERALLTGEPRAANVTALTNVSTLAMDRDTFEEAIGPLQGLMEREMRKNFLKGLPIFANSSVTVPEIDQLVDLMTEVCYRKGDKLAEAGKSYVMNLWIIRHGQLLVYSQTKDKLYNLKTGDYFGDKSVQGEEGRISSHNAICEDNLTAWVLTRKDIEAVIGDIERLGKPSNYEKSLQDKSILLDDLKKHRILGMGAFGRVWLVSHKNEGKAYALKAIAKRKLLESKQENSVMREKELLCVLQHPFILHLVSSFQDENNLYLLLPLIQGGELFSVLQKRKQKESGLPNNDAAFYAGCIVEALGHFHQRLIAYRDLKLENVLIDAEGYCKVIDLGFAKIVTDKTYTLVGTPEYLCPEIIMAKGHDKAVDYWALGVLIYELLVGRSPFYAPHSSQIDMFKRSE